MALATRELELILIARDHASATVARIGGAFTILGGIITAVGLKGARELGEMTAEAMEFRQSIALAVTQTDIVGTTIEDVAGIINRVGKKLPVPFEELNEAMFDIFSTFTSDQLKDLEQAEVLLTEFSKSAVAGQAPLRDITRSSIAWINALNQEATLENITKILEVQFELVRKGAGTYGEFAGEVGKAIPAFAAANQDLDTFGGMMAFLTKSGLNPAMAATSAARAVELMFSPKAIKGLKAVGVAIEDDAGKFRSMEDIIRDLQPVFGGLSDAGKKLKFKEIFGTGRIQARRFFDLAIPNFEELDFLIGEMEDSGGNVEEAFRLMFEQPLSKMDVFRNRWEALRREIGESFFETMETWVFPTLQKLFDWWDALDQPMKDQYIWWTKIGVAATIAAGAFLVFLGIALLLGALFQAFSFGAVVAGIGKLLLALGWIGLVIAVLAVAVWWLWNNWEKVRDFAIDMWEKIGEAVARFVEENRVWLDKVVAKSKIIWERLKELARVAWERILIIWATIWERALTFWERWGDQIKATFSAVWTEIKIAFLFFLDVIIAFLDIWIAVFQGHWRDAWDALWRLVGHALNMMLHLFIALGHLILLAWDMLWRGIQIVADVVWDWIFERLRYAWKRIADTAVAMWNAIFEFFKGIIIGIINWFKDLITFFRIFPNMVVVALGVLVRMLWDLGARIMKAFWGAIVWVWDNILFPAFVRFPLDIIAIWATWPGRLWTVGTQIITGLWNGVKFVWATVYTWFTTVKDKTLAALGTVITWLYEKGKAILQGMWDGIVFVWELLKTWFNGLPDILKTLITKPFEILKQVGKDIIDGLWKGMKSMWTNVTGWLGKLNPANWFNDINPKKGHAIKNLVETGELVMTGLERGLTIGFDKKVVPLLQQMTLNDIPNTLRQQTIIPQTPTPITNLIPATPEPIVNVNVYLDSELVTDKMLERTGLDQLTNRLRGIS